MSSPPASVRAGTMEHPGGVTGLTPGVTAWTAESIASLPPGERRTMAALVDEAGARSARAQALPTAITSTVRERWSASIFSRKGVVRSDDDASSRRRRASHRTRTLFLPTERRTEYRTKRRTRVTRGKTAVLRVELTYISSLFLSRRDANLRVPQCAPYVKKKKNAVPS